MPDDTVFTPPAAGAENPPETPGATQTPVPPAGVSQEQLDAKFAPIEKSLGEMSNFFTKLQEQATATRAAAEAPPAEDWATEFYNKPQETVQQEIAAQAAPILQQNATFSAKVLMDKQHETVDKRWGEGTWAEEFEPVLAPIVADAIKNYPTSLSNPTAVQNAVNTIIGDKFDALTARASKLAETSEEPNKELIDQVASQVVEMTGGIRRSPNSAEEKLDDEDSQEFLKEIFRQTGEQRDPKRLAKLMNTGPYFEDWQGATKEDK